MIDSYCRRLIDSFESRRDMVAMRIVGDDTQVYSFGESLDIIRSLAYRIGAEKIEFGDRVALIGENHPCWALSYLGIIYRGAVCVPMDPHGEIETITNFLENSKAKLAFIGAEVVEKFSLIQEKLGRHIPAIVWNSHDAEARTLVRAEHATNGQNTFSEWSASGYPEIFAKEIPKAAGDDTALLIYTSGTTGTPKGVPLTHGNILAELDGINEVIKLSDKESILSLLPLFHAYLQIVNLWAATTYGCQAGYLKELSPAELSSAMKEFKPTILTTVPRLWYLFHKKIFDAVEAKPKPVQMIFRTMLAINGFSRSVFGVNLGHKMFGKVHEGFGGNLRIAISAGSRFDEAVARDFQKLGFTIIQGYGLTETSGAATATHETDNRIGSVGKPMLGAEVKIGEPDTQGVGEVLIRGEMVFNGYYNNPEATAEAFTDDGWFRSGDLGRLDKDGHLFIVGRAKDVVVLPSGKNVHPEDLEVHYLKAPEVEELAILGVADETEERAGAEKLVAVVIPDFEYLKQAKIANSKEAIRYALDNLSRELPEYQRVREYIIRAEQLPRTATRKIKRFELKKEIESGKLSNGASEKKVWELAEADNTQLQTNVAKAVISVLKKHVKNGALIHPKMNLEIDLGLDSLARAEVFAALENGFETEFTADEAAGAVSVANVIDLAKTTPFGANLDSDVASKDVAVATDLNWSKIIKEADEYIPEVETVLKDRPLFAGFAFLVYRCFNLFCRVFMRLEVEGIENITKAAGRNASLNEHASLQKPAPSKGETIKADGNPSLIEHAEPPKGGTPNAFLIAPNHQSFLDPFVLTSNYPFHVFRNIFHVGASMFFQGRFMRFVARMLNVVPIDQDTQLLKAMKAGAIGLKHGKILNIYPEGERAFDGKLHDFKKGAAILALELDLPIVPVAIDGLHKVWARRSWKIRPAKVKIKIGTPFFAREVASAQLSVATSAALAGNAGLNERASLQKPARSNGEMGEPPHSESPNNDQLYSAVTDHLKQIISTMIKEMRSS
ncbi:MAG: AMP-binding protein [Pyrinomonadaceae bacterium]